MAHGDRTIPATIPGTVKIPTPITLETNSAAASAGDKVLSNVVVVESLLDILMNGEFIVVHRRDGQMRLYGMADPCRLNAQEVGTGP
jgi:hypothetical protein